MKRFGLTSMVMLLALLLAACGGARDNTNDGGSGAAELRFEANDSLRFEPASATVAAGAEIDVELRNVGALEHSWVLVGEDVDLNTVTDADALAGTAIGPIAGGSSATVGFTAPAAGTYRYVCTVPGHAAGGMVGTLTVQ